MDFEGLHLLSEQECRGLLREARVGRVGVSLGEVPAVFPVNYMVAGDEIWFFTAEGTKLRAATAKSTVTFEVDEIDPFTETGWSVIVVGPARERVEPSVVVAARRAGLRPWAAGDRFHLVSVAMDFVSGRRIERVIDVRKRAGSPAGRVPGTHPRTSDLADPAIRLGATLLVGAEMDAGPRQWTERRG